MVPVTPEQRAFALELAEASGVLIRRHFGDPGLAVELKADRTIVTRADREAERLLRDMIAQRFPDHGVVGEEFGPEREDAEWVWILDPIDGTVSFAAGVPLFGTLIALAHRGQPVLGLIHQPISGELVVGDGEGTTGNGRPVRVRSTVRPEEAFLLATDIRHIERHQDGAAFSALLRRVKTFRGWGDAYGYLMVATGRADIMCDPIMNPWDIAALIPVIRGAGGVITDWHGGDPVGAASIIASATPELHAAVLSALAPSSRD